MYQRVLVALLLAGAFAASAADGGKGGDGGKGADGGNGSDGGSTSSTPGRPGCPGGTNPDPWGKFYLPGTREPCNPGKQDGQKVAM